LHGWINVRLNLRRKARFFAAGLMVFAFACSRTRADFGEEPHELTVFAASSLTDAFREITDLFEIQHPEVEVILNLSGSSQLVAQLREGVIADVFASASPAQMRVVIDGGMVSQGEATDFVTNRLTIIVPVDNPARIRSLADLAQPDVQLLLAVKGVPVRAYSDKVIAGLGTIFEEMFYRNVVSEEDNVRQVTAKIALGEADAGLVYVSDITPSIAGLVQQVAIPEDLNVVANYSIAPLREAPHPELARLFIDFVLNPEGQDILSKWGFGPRIMSGSGLDEDRMGAQRGRS
jgi:molybdate transport system substrate-binding protein